MKDAGTGGLFGLVDMNPVHGSTVGTGSGLSDCVIEKEDTVGASLLEKQGLNFRIVELFDRRIIIESFSGGGGGDSLESAEGVDVEAEVGFAVADVTDLDW